MTAGQEELLPCPFCGSRAAFTCEHFRFIVACHHCGFDQGERDNEQAARAAWNRRAALSTAASGLSGAQGEEAMELNLCESAKLHLHPDRLYRFTVDPECDSCRKAAAHYDESFAAHPIAAPQQAGEPCGTLLAEVERLLPNDDFADDLNALIVRHQSPPAPEARDGFRLLEVGEAPRPRDEIFLRNTRQWSEVGDFPEGYKCSPGNLIRRRCTFTDAEGGA